MPSTAPVQASVGAAGAEWRRRGDDVPRIIVVEALTDQRLSMQQALEHVGYEVRAEAEGGKIERVVREFAPHVAVLNSRQVHQPCGYVMTRILRRTTDLPILLVVAKRDPEEFRIFGLDSGVDQMIAEPFATAELVARVGALVRRADRVITEFSVGEFVLNTSTRSATRNGEALDLTPREFDLLLALVQNPGRALPKQTLASLAWGPAASATTSVAVHMSALRRKLESAGKPTIHTARGVGYVMHV